MTKISDIYLEDARFVSSRMEQKIHVPVPEDYMRAMRWHILQERIASRKEADTTRSSVTGY